MLNANTFQNQFEGKISAQLQYFHFALCACWHVQRLIFKKWWFSTWLPVSYASKSHVTQLSLAVSFPSLSNLCPSKWSLWTLPAFGNRFYRPIIPAIQKYLQSYYPSHMKCFRKRVSLQNDWFSNLTPYEKFAFELSPSSESESIHVFFPPNMSDQGQYQHQKGQEKCLVCPQGTTTPGLSSSTLEARHGRHWNSHVGCMEYPLVI